MNVLHSPMWNCAGGTVMNIEMSTGSLVALDEPLNNYPGCSFYGTYFIHDIGPMI